MSASVIIAVAGMEGALASVIGGLAAAVADNDFAVLDTVGLEENIAV